MNDQEPVVSKHDEKPPNGKPKHPLNPYNVYYQVIRRRIISDTDFGHPISPGEVRVVVLHYRNKPRGDRARPHRKTHGKISFQSLSKRLMLKKASNEDRARYYDQVKIWEETSSSSSASSSPSKTISIHKALAETFEQFQGTKDATSSGGSNEEVGAQSPTQRKMSFSETPSLISTTTPADPSFLSSVMASDTRRSFPLLSLEESYGVRSFPMSLGCGRSSEIPETGPLPRTGSRNDPGPIVLEDDLSAKIHFLLNQDPIEPEAMDMLFNDP